MADLKVSFPKPCSEPWDGMGPRGCNRHCASCDRIVHDLAKLTVEQVEQLLDTDEKVCVRAEFDRQGRIKSAGSTGRAMIVCAGALLAAACQTTPGGRVADGATLSGNLGYHIAREARIWNDAGESAKLVVGHDGRFDVHGLRPGTYSLQFTVECNQQHDVQGIVVAENDVDLGRLDFETDCIIVGHMVREAPTERG